MTADRNDPDVVTTDSPSEPVADDSIQHPSPLSEKRWPASAALVTSWLCPATTARRTDHISLGRAFGVHVVACLIGTAVVFFLLGWDRAIFQSDIGDAWPHALIIVRDVAKYVVGNPFAGISAILGIAVGVWLSFVCVALMLAPWGARDELFRASIARGLRRTWLQTSHLVAAVLLLWGGESLLRQAEKAYSTQHPYPHVDPNDWPAPPTTQPVTTQAQMTYETEMEAVWERNRAMVSEWRGKGPWYVQYRGLLTYLEILPMAWLIWGVLRSMGASSRVPSMDRPPLCEFCGYNLTGAAMDWRCPECGRPVAESLGPSVRPGAPWERRAELGRWRAWWRCVLDPILRPTRFGRQIRVVERQTSYRSFLMLHVLAAVVVVPAVVVVDFLVTENTTPAYLVVDILEGSAVASAICAFLATVIVALSTAGLVGLSEVVRFRGNMLPASMQMAGYLGGYLVFFAAYVATTSAVVIENWMAFTRLFQTLSHWEILFCSVWFGPYFLLWVGYAVLISRGTAAARYANR